MVDRKRPPTLAMQRPAIRIGNVEEAHSITELTAKIEPPRANVRVRDILSGKGPATRDATDAVAKIIETIKPCSVGEMGSKASLNCGMTVTGPIDPVGSVTPCYQDVQIKSVKLMPVSNPNRKPPVICEYKSYATGRIITNSREQSTPSILSKAYGASAYSI
jgi:hypothetical protein